jgi:SulP family sulfate permease
MRNVVAIDASGLQILDEVLTSMQRAGTALILSAVSAQPLAAMRQSGLLKRLGEENVAENIFVALKRARTLIDGTSERGGMTQGA